MDRAISYYEANRGTYELAGRVYASGNMGVPQALTLVQDETGAAGRAYGSGRMVGRAAAAEPLPRRPSITHGCLLMRCCGAAVPKRPKHGG